MGFAEESGIPLRMGLIRNHYVGRTFIEPQAAIRHFGVRVKLNPGEEHPRRQARHPHRRFDRARHDEPEDRERWCVRPAPREVHVRISCPPTISPCFYGIDTPRRSELIAATHTLDEITKYLDADSVAYLSLDGLMSAVGATSGSYCSSCYTGRYPVDFPRDQASYLQLALKLDKTAAVVE